MTKKVVLEFNADAVEGRCLIIDGFSLILQGLQRGFGLDLEDPNFEGTPARVAKAYEEIFSGLRDTDKQIQEILSATFPCDYSEMVIEKDIRVFSMCPHHFLPVDLNISVAYIPSSGGRVLGISKLSRLVEILAKRPCLQEKLSNDITESLMNIPGCSGSACFVEGRHYCKIMRGVCQHDSTTISSSVRGVFMDEPETKAEFLSLARHG